MTYDLSGTCLALELAQGPHPRDIFLCQQFLGFLPMLKQPAPKRCCGR